MSDRIIEEIAIVLVVGAVGVAVIWQLGVSRRARAALARDTDYRKIAERAVAAQEATDGRLADVTGRLTEMNLRVAAIERVLKDAE
ncbi:hypothetical protein K7640_27450 [Micromonospora sp. PLK6-60]|uniref:hypothetical protein n=1 Tax=Micromonospora sp. PLK6-60 TaxID=2873383 RepID=UPI001CA78BB7|nr:hypothetical protein [Micromonospora sp. PLK6-60]MBY8875571.1 hypothetical protein [Micromonospora sp. PLK6-60]